MQKRKAKEERKEEGKERRRWAGNPVEPREGTRFSPPDAGPRFKTAPGGRFSGSATAGVRAVGIPARARRATPDSSRQVHTSAQRYAPRTHTRTRHLGRTRRAEFAHKEQVSMWSDLVDSRREIGHSNLIPRGSARVGKHKLTHFDRPLRNRPRSSCRHVDTYRALGLARSGTGRTVPASSCRPAPGPRELTRWPRWKRVRFPRIRCRIHPSCPAWITETRTSSRPPEITGKRKREDGRKTLAVEPVGFL